MWEKRFYAINDGLKLEIFEWKGRKVDIFSTEQNEKKGETVYKQSVYDLFSIAAVWLRDESRSSIASQNNLIPGFGAGFRFVYTSRKWMKTDR